MLIDALAALAGYLRPRSFVRVLREAGSCRGPSASVRTLLTLALAIGLVATSVLALQAASDPIRNSGVCENDDDLTTLLADPDQAAQSLDVLPSIAPRPIVVAVARLAAGWMPDVPASLAHRFRSPPPLL